jgi:Lon protease-like protein
MVEAHSEPAILHQTNHERSYDDQLADSASALIVLLPLNEIGLKNILSAMKPFRRQTILLTLITST